MELYFNVEWKLQEAGQLMLKENFYNVNCNGKVLVKVLAHNNWKK